MEKDNAVRDFSESGSRTVGCEYHYQKFLAHAYRKAECEFRFRDHEYYIGYWDGDPAGTWIPGWVFTNDLGRTLLVNERNFREFIRRVNDWMKENEGTSLQGMFGTCYRTDNTGALQMLSPGGTGEQGQVFPPGQ